MGTVLSRTFFTLFKHPFIFLGLSFLAQVPRLIVTALTQGSSEHSYSIDFIFGPVMQGARALHTALIPRWEHGRYLNFMLGLVMQSAVAYGVCEVLQGSVAKFGTSLSKGLARIGPLSLATLSYCIFLTLVVFGGAMLTRVLGLNALPVIILVWSVMWCKWCVFLPACVVERLGPIESLNRSSILTKGCRLKIAALYLLSFVINAVVMSVLGFTDWILRVPFDIQQFAAAVPMAFASVMTAVMYYELRNVKEGVTIECF